MAEASNSDIHYIILFNVYIDIPIHHFTKLSIARSPQPNHTVDGTKYVND